METINQPFNEFLKTCFDGGSYSTDDVIAFVMPVFEEVLHFHEAGLVGPFEVPSALFINKNQLDIDEALAHAPTHALQSVNALFNHTRSLNFNITGNVKLDVNVETGEETIENLQVHADPSLPLKYPAFVPGYSCYEILAGHHDALTDIFCLGLLVGSMSLSLDLNDHDDLKEFVQYRVNPVAHNDRIHPALSQLITGMTEPDRTKRAADLYDIINRLQHYRDFDPERQTDLSKVAGWVHKDIKDRGRYILSRLRNRLFDTSRRNRLLYYKPNMRFVNLTVSSVPIVLHYQSIKPELLFTWNDEISSKMRGMKEIILNKYLRFEDHLYLPTSLDKIRVEAQCDLQEFGFSQLKLVACFLSWNNLREDKNERIQSPLLLFPVQLKKNKKLKEDHYVLTATDNAAEVNPVLANFLKDLYGIKLPDFVDLDDSSMKEFYETLRQQIEGTNQGIILNYIDKPPIKLVHSVAKLTVNSYRKRLRRMNGQSDSYKEIDYSYQPEHYKPLGLEIFRQRIESKASRLEFLINDDIHIGAANLTGDEPETERRLFELTTGTVNPYAWDFDICNIVLGNFNYKKMSLVRDYNDIIEQNIENPVFEKLFSDKPRELSAEIASNEETGDWFHIITADPTQSKAILKGREGRSYIIQGPPGTGKSQTITNLIADFIARGKSILFVCEKRAALDVVYYRLKQQNLDELCCYIHDSQGDKKEFIRDLKNTYEDFIKNRKSLNEVTIKRNIQLEQFKEEIEVLRLFHSGNKKINDETGIPFTILIDQLAGMSENGFALSPKEEELLPQYSDWLSYGKIITELSNILEESGAAASFADHPFSKLNDDLFRSAKPLTLIDELGQQISVLLEELSLFIDINEIDRSRFHSIDLITNIVDAAVLLRGLAETANLQLLDNGSVEAKKYDAETRQMLEIKEAHEVATKLNANWKNKFSADDTDRALLAAIENEGAFFGFLNSDWRRLKKQLHASYAFENHQARPAYSKILHQLKTEYETAEKFLIATKRFQKNYNIQNIEVTDASIQMLRDRRNDFEIDYLLGTVDAASLIIKLVNFKNTYDGLKQKLKQFFRTYGEKNVPTLSDELENISLNLDSASDLIPSLRDFSELPGNVKSAFSTLSLSASEAQGVIARKSLKTIYSRDKKFASLDMHAVKNAVDRIALTYNTLLRLNAEFVQATIRQRFLQHVELSNMALSQLDMDQKKFKKDYNEGRKILENEFSKSMRYKSIRELTARESGLILKDLKPIWLMSPLSVSDSLPVDSSYFDIIIFDEASQITLEEGMPSLYRAPMAVIVGDDKQMPPADFFTAKAGDADEMRGYNDETEDELLTHDADSLLTQGVKKLDSVMLGWHYRSRYETLISFSNYAFYKGSLLTIPDKKIHEIEKPPIVVNSAGEATSFTDALYDRSLSFHYLTNSIYEKRKNQEEADYIAQMLRELLKREVKESIGIVAFSQEQQHTIEDALTALAAADKQFEGHLEENYNRTEDDQFVGLFVKNLENVQGDERDIIIMSVCYGFDSKKRMIMNFGPINRKGGEKRLNVIFSRAKKHMAIISSIKHFNITNEYNEGANYLKQFLHYSELVSTGNISTAMTILNGLTVTKEVKRGPERDSVILQQIKRSLEIAGYTLKVGVGHSGFKCSLALKLKEEDEFYTLGILLDDENNFLNDNVLEQYYQRPAILKSFGWKVIFVSGKDWLRDPDKVLSSIEKTLQELPGSHAAPVPDGANTSADNILPVDTAVAGGSLFIQTAPGLNPTIYDDLHFRRLEYKDDASHKFWEVGTDDLKLIVRFGKIGSRGQVQVKSFKDFSAADKEKEKMTKEKLAKGYKLI